MIIHHVSSFLLIYRLRNKFQLTPQERISVDRLSFKIDLFPVLIGPRVPPIAPPKIEPLTKLSSLNKSISLYVIILKNTCYDS